MNMVEQQQYITAGLPHTGDLAGSHSLSDDRSIVSVGTPTYSEVTPFSAVCISRLTPQNPALYFAALQLFSPLSCPVFCNGCKLTNRFFSPIGLFFQHPCFVRPEPSYSHLFHQLSPAPADP